MPQICTEDGIECYNNPDPVLTKLSSLGIMSGEECSSLELTGPLDSIRASWSDENYDLESVKFYKGEMAKTYGTLMNTYK